MWIRDIRVRLKPRHLHLNLRETVGERAQKRFVWIREIRVRLKPHSLRQNMQNLREIVLVRPANRKRIVFTLAAVGDLFARLRIFH